MKFYYVLYDLNDMPVAYFKDGIEVSNFTGIRIYDLNYFFNKSKKDYIGTIINSIRYHLYRFAEVEE